MIFSNCSQIYQNLPSLFNLWTDKIIHANLCKKFRNWSQKVLPVLTLIVDIRVRSNFKKIFNFPFFPEIFLFYQSRNNPFFVIFSLFFFSRSAFHILAGLSFCEVARVVLVCSHHPLFHALHSISFNEFWVWLLLF